MSAAQPERDDDEADQQPEVDASREGREQSQAMNRMTDESVRRDAVDLVGRARVIGRRVACIGLRVSGARARAKGGQLSLLPLLVTRAPSLTLPPPRNHNPTNWQQQNQQEREISLDANKVQKVRRIHSGQGGGVGGGVGGSARPRSLPRPIEPRQKHSNSPPLLRRHVHTHQHTTNRRCWH